MFDLQTWLLTIRLGLKNLFLNKLRSFLTMLGVVLGVASVIAMLAIGEGSKREALEQIQKLGARNIIIDSVKPGTKIENEQPESTGEQTLEFVAEYGLTYKDLDIFRATLPTLERIVPVAQLRRDVLRKHRILENARILGVTPDYQHVKHLRVFRGRFISDKDLFERANVCVLGPAAALRLFGHEDPLGKTVYLGEYAYLVVGELYSAGAGSEHGGTNAKEVAEFDRRIYIPLTAARYRFGEIQIIRASGSLDFEKVQLHEIILTCKSMNVVLPTATMVSSILERTHEKQDYEIQVPLELLRRAQQEKRIWNLVLGSIAGISLVVGGIGIMNIMLATVTERTREIGIRRALGAKRRHILMQFLIETLVLSCTGGIVGVVVGVAIPLWVEYMFGMRVYIAPWTIGLAFGISAAVGVIFGMYPARRAAYMDPIEALRHVG